ncbi:Protein CyaY [Dickeya dianthicola]|uniref:Iron-sulfur cluster assembly protein CyaY n=1 Tax=Dickeya dianthicola TaxID=204039 RepID=A0AAP6VF57_9GAMM|nr:iron donor protein CyaY [Dickeya dianthicola]ATO35145.1 Frataxin-like protein CyaY, facilitates iron suppl for heme A synthesis or Fe-S cluster assembly [Dickeya dianthicola RNS04.9]AYC20949.1 Protein CyaY [Dickeya dianthicola]MBI0438949.1 iron donor protein CyaY [Dickeya dianthicola]MBI0449428.1 iron donor protein CyaY [Dickeya dianthicola]MBI0453746.1 iron donor protein CyaY [Dickeya dianthicola]
MNDSEFHQLADALMLKVEETLDQFDGDADIDYETNGGVMTLSFENGSKIVINRQEPMHQVWLATKGGGYHFNYQHSRWICDRSGSDFMALLAQACSEQSGADVYFE